MPTDSDRLVVLTGGPGGGKSTLLGALSALGYEVAPEAGRAIIRDQALIGGRLREDPVAFAETILTWEMRSYRLSAGTAGPVFFDRGVVDVAASYLLLGLPVPPHVDAAVAAFPYRRSVFLAAPWREIYSTDDERTQSWDEAVATCEAVVAAYTRYGYDLVELPYASVSDRVAFVLERV